MTRRPFQHIADEFELSDELRSKMLELLRNMSYSLPMQPFKDYAHIRSIPMDKFLVTTGFVKLQMSKVEMLGIANDFKDIIIVDPDVSAKTKKDVFMDIMKAHHYQPEELLIIGDDPNSEIRAAQELGIDTFLYDPENRHPDAGTTYKAGNLKEAANALF